MPNPTPQGLVLITGAAKRIGREIALVLAGAGWDIALHYNISEKEARETAQRVQALGRESFLIQADLSDPNDVETLLAKTRALSGRSLTALVNNASLFVKNEDPMANKQRQVNTETPQRLARLLADQIAEGACGSCVHILEGTDLPPNFSLYAESQALLRASLETEALALAPRLRLNALNPGPSLLNPRQSKAHFEGLVAATPLKTPSPPLEIAKAVRFLLETKSLTGALIPLDGGMHLLNQVVALKN